MIVSCPSCNKKFNLNLDLIPQDGRQLQCGNCDHKWFYTKPEFNENVKKEKVKIIKEFKKKEEIVNQPRNINKNESLSKNINQNKKIKVKKLNYLNLFIVFLITLVSLVVLLDTFKNQLNDFIPGIDNILNNLYESIRDINLFIKDLLK